MLARTDASGSAYYHSDGNGNVTGLVNGGGVLVARYSYDPYGNVLGQEGPLAEANTYRFSSKRLHSKGGVTQDEAGKCSGSSKVVLPNSPP